MTADKGKRRGRNGRRALPRRPRATRALPALSEPVGSLFARRRTLSTCRLVSRSPWQSTSTRRNRRAPLGRGCKRSRYPASLPSFRTWGKPRHRRPQRRRDPVVCRRQAPSTTFRDTDRVEQPVPGDKAPARRMPSRLAGVRRPAGGDPLAEPELPGGAPIRLTGWSWRQAAFSIPETVSRLPFPTRWFPGRW